MLKKRIFPAIMILIIAAVLLNGCLFPQTPDETLPETEEPANVTFPSPNVSIRPPSEPGRFTIRYVPDSTVNPITSQTRDNIVLSSLLYESLFTLDGDLNVSPVLCESWATEDDTTYTFLIKPDVAMSDGSFLTADDVVYTLKQAMQKGRFVNWLKIIKSVRSDEEMTVTVVLDSANSHFIRMLDIPVIKDGSIDEDVPPGTGPYMFAGAGVMRLDRFPQYRDIADLPISEIYLLECDDNELAELFDSGELNLLWDDPSDTLDIILNRHNEPRFYDTTAMQFIGFNTKSIVLQDPDVRRAIGSSVNRRYIIDNIMPGQLLAAPLALSPAYRLYDPQWEQMVFDPLFEMSALFDRAELEDFDKDSFLEFPDGAGGFIEIALDFIVNSENTHKVKAAHKIADTLKLYGFKLIVRELTWDVFQDELKAGHFDIYYGEIMLSADFDLSPLLYPNSHLNYGSTGSDIYKPLVSAFLSAQDDDEEKQAAENLCDEINFNAPFVPILYKRYVVYTPIGAVSGASPSQSAVFNDFVHWSIDLTMIP